MQAYRTLQAIRTEIDGDEANCFALFPAYRLRFKAADKINYCELLIAPLGHFQAAFFAPRGCRRAAVCIRLFVGLDGCHTKSRFRIILLIACGVDANDIVILLA